MVEKFLGEQEFLKHFEEHHKLSELREKKYLTKEEAHSSLKEFIKQLHQEIEELPEIKKEAEIHHQSVEEISNVLSTGLKLVLEKGIFDGLQYIAATKNPYLIDTFHDLLAGHFFKFLVKKNKIKII
ncbi:MAG: hypothetical protein KatS3mg094_205 [Candidatus Parcubacteria bacterium]|nr:MAG: hypothetical protein KatS3mg094_205 [Candidatus Parcubacteria bacterium]